MGLAARLVSFAAVCGILYWGQVILMPLALAALVTFLLSPAVGWLQRRRLPRLLSGLIVVGLVTAAQAEPVQVEIAPERGSFDGIAIFVPVVEVVATAGRVMLLSIFMLITREDLRNRLLSLVGRGSLVVASEPSRTRAGRSPAIS